MDKNRKNRELTPIHRKEEDFFFPVLNFGNVLERIDQFFSQSLLKPGFKVRMQETKDQYVILAELPGVKKEDIHIEILDNELYIRAKYQEFLSLEDGKNNTYQHKKTYRSMSRRIFLYHPVYENQIKATYQNGLLTVVLKKKRGKTVNIKET